VAYGIAGWTLEILMTGAAGLFSEERDVAAPARTYLWMYPIYGLGGLALEQIRHRLRRLPRMVRAAAYVPAIFAIEAATGALLRRLIGSCPGGPTATPTCAARSAPRLRAPLVLVGLAFEPLHGAVSGPPARPPSPPRPPSCRQRRTPRLTIPHNSSSSKVGWSPCFGLGYSFGDRRGYRIRAPTTR
jgi:hypothetical protein